MTAIGKATQTAARGSVTSERGCWIWQGGVQSKGYPSIGAGKRGRSQQLTRAVLAEKLGRPPTLYALHTCDVKRCVNPDHLYEGTPKRNALDAVERGRTAKGAKNGRCKIDEATAMQIKGALIDGYRVSNVAKAHGLPRSIVDGIKKGIVGSKGGTWVWL